MTCCIRLKLYDIRYTDFTSNQLYTRFAYGDFLVRRTALTNIHYLHHTILNEISLYRQNRNFETVLLDKFSRLYRSFSQVLLRRLLCNSCRYILIYY